MRLSKVRIVNFRNFLDTTIDPFPSPAVIVGENGVGKSNLLRALRLVLDPDLPTRLRRLKADDVHDGAPPLHGGVTVTVQVELTDFDDDFDAIATLDGAIVSSDGQARVARLTYCWQPREAAEMLGRRLTPDDYTFSIYGADDPGTRMREALDYLPLSVLPALRDAEGDFARADRSPLTRLLRERPPSEAAVQDTMTALRDARARLNQDVNVQQAVAELGARLDALTGPQLPLTPTLDFAGREEDLLRSVQLFVDPAATRGIAHTSTGTANLVYLALLLEHLRLRRAAVDGEDTLLAVEEPEAHLHPALQRKVFTHLLRQPDRLLLTTHSSHIAAVAPLSSLVLLSRNGAETGASVVPPGLLSAEETADLEHYINVTRAEVLFARAVVFVEGTADAYLLPALAQAAGFHFDDYGIVVSSVEGTDFAPYATLLGPEALDRPHWILTDGDATNRQKIHEKEPGLWRARKLLDVAGHTELHETLDRGIKEITEHELPERGSRPDRFALTERAALGRVYVGEHTLEVDIAPLLAIEMGAAYNAFRRRSDSRTAFADILCRVADYDPSKTERDDFLDKIEMIGKGRYAQRLAGLVCEMDLRGRVEQLLTPYVPGQIIREDLERIAGAAAILTLLDDLSHAVRGVGLFATPPGTPAAATPGPVA